MQIYRGIDINPNMFVDPCRAYDCDKVEQIVDSAQ